jgi:hypothetical protein
MLELLNYGLSSIDQRLQSKDVSKKGGVGAREMVWIFSMSLKARTMEEIHGE